MTTTNYPRMKQLVDWSAALWAGLAAGGLFWLFNVIAAPLFLSGNSWVYIRLLASVVLGEEVVAPPATFSLAALIASIGATLILAVIFALILAAIVHRWGMKVSVIVGALFGIALYCINFYSFTYFFPWFFLMRSWVMIAAHILFGILAGGIYEALEVVEFVPVLED